jgi:hypothetical protein
MVKPTEEYTKYQEAFDHFNRELFDKLLSPCLITLPNTRRRAGGYFRNQGFAARNNHTLRTHEIALNPRAFAGSDDKEILSILVHEMVHLKQAQEGNPGRNGYHTLRWARDMLSRGLRPISLDNPGKMTGQRVTHEIVPGGPFDVAAGQLLATGFSLRWQAADAVAMRHNHTGMEEPSVQEPSPRNKVKYTCPECGLNVWGKPRARLICGYCTDMKELKKYIPLTWLSEISP